MDYNMLLERAEQAVKLIGGGAEVIHKLRQLVKTAKNGDVDAAHVSELVLQLQNQIIDARNAQSALLNDLIDLKQEMAKMDRHLQIKTRYELSETPAGALVLALRKAHHGNEPMHYICPDCADRAQKRYLQPHGTGKRCHGCKRFFPFAPVDNSARRVPRNDRLF